VSDVDTLRWGDAFSFQFSNAATGRNATVNLNRQLAQARWRWPIQWGLRVIIVPHFNADEAGDVTVNVLVTVGSGQNSTTAVFSYLVAPTAGVYPVCINDFQQIPASDVQVTAQLLTGQITSATLETLEVGIYLAPVTEPHAMTRMYEAMVEGKPEGKRWMQDYGEPSPQNPGTGIAFPINPDPLHYQRR
jgi:hypothetical protein